MPFFFTQLWHLHFLNLHSKQWTVCDWNPALYSFQLPFFPCCRQVIHAWWSYFFYVTPAHIFIPESTNLYKCVSVVLLLWESGAIFNKNNNGQVCLKCLVCHVLTKESKRWRRHIKLFMSSFSYNTLLLFFTLFLSLTHTHTHTNTHWTPCLLLSCTEQPRNEGQH